ncbi:anaphase-promoting complex subunit 5 isoform X2 [Euphorbia lathyris]|uniref:anaphase-promoting complex subunit 5 isoform X2 n=1 Tax=Euphorbia lathyris TaxID=212925 RepID=UPI0033137AE1
MAVADTFSLTPHKVSVCYLLQLYTNPTQVSSPFSFSSVSQHNRLGLYLLSLTKSYDDILEPKFEELITQLREIGGSLGHLFIDNLTNKFSHFEAPDDLFIFFGEMRGILGGSEAVLEDNQVILDPNSILGMYLRRCILAFNTMLFEGACYLWLNMGNYCKQVLSGCLPYGLHRLDGSSNGLEDENMELENYDFEKVTDEVEDRKQPSERVPFHLHASQAFCGLIEGNASGDVDQYDEEREVFLRTNWQVQGHLMEQADAIEKHGSSFRFNAFELTLRQIKKLAPDLHRVHYLRYLSSLYHDDYFAAVENLLCYFDYSAGTEGFEFAPPSSVSSKSERYEIALLCLGMMHFYFGHPKQALLVLTEAVRVSQEQSNDSCLAYTLSTICNMLSEIGSSTTVGILGTSYSPMTSMAISVSVAQQLFVLLRESLKRAESLKLKRLVASNHLAMAKFDLMHVQRPLQSFGPKASLKLKTSPINVCKELRLCSQLISEFASEPSTVTIDGAFSTTWLKNLTNPIGSIVLSQENGCGENSLALQCCVQSSSIPRSVLQLLGSSYLLRATAWEMYASAPLARINALVYTTCFTDSSSSSDAAVVHAKLIQHLAVFQGYKEAFAALKVAEGKFFSVSRSVILLLKLQLLHERALHRGHLKLAQEICDELGVLASPVTGVDMELKRVASLRRARTLLAAKQYSEAAAVAHSLFCMCYKFNMQVENATVLLLLAEIHKKSGNAVLGLPYALASLSFCQSFNLDLLKASATLTLAELWLLQGSNHAKRALVLVHGVLPMVLGNGGLELRARAHIAEAKCYLSDPSYSVSKDPEVVLDPLKQASDELQILEYHELAAETFYLMAIVFDKLGKINEREEAAASFKKHITALENPEDEDDPWINLSR